MSRDAQRRQGIAIHQTSVVLSSSPRTRESRNSNSGPPHPWVPAFAGTTVRYLAAVLALALGYWITGWLGLLLAIPPGYATAVWPPSGIAIAGVLLGGYRVWPGVWLGSFFLNVWTALDASSPAALIGSLLPPALIGGGAALQAVIGVFLIRRLVGYGNLLELELRSVYLLALGGPVASVINASCGVTTLWAVGLIPSANFAFNWWTWWIGDSVGVLIFTPLILVWSVRPYKQWLYRQLTATLPLVPLFVLVVLLFVYTSAREQGRIQAQFDSWGKAFAQQLRHDTGQYVEMLYALQALFESSRDVQRSEFEGFAARLLPYLPGAAVVDYFTPRHGNERAFGLDIAAEARRQSALDGARQTGAAFITAPLALVRDPEQRTGFLVVLPVFRPNPAAGKSAASAELAGYVVAAFRMADVVERTLVRLSERNDAIEVRIVDQTEGEPQLLYGAAAPAAAPSGALVRRIPFEIAGRQWRLDLHLPADYLVTNRSWQAWWLLAVGMLFTGLFGMFLLVMIGRTSMVERQVAERTAELQKANNLLLAEMRRSQEFELEALAHANELAASNRELEQFAYIASHDLQAPLRTVSGFAGLLRKRYGPKLDAAAQEFLDTIVAGAKEMQQLIEDLLSYSRVSAERMHLEAVNAGDAARSALEALDADVQAAQAEIDLGPLPLIQADARLLTQLFQNLIGNGIKFRHKDQIPRVGVSADRSGAAWHFHVRDNGIGIPAEQLDQLFLMFKRLHRTEEYPGTGIGLALCKKIVQIHGGRIWCESESGQGTTFHFTWPAAAPNAQFTAEGAEHAEKI